LVFCKLERALKIHHTPTPRLLWHRNRNQYWVHIHFRTYQASQVVLSLQIGVGFRLSLVASWGCLSLVSRAFICFVGTLEPSKTRLGRLFTYPFDTIVRNLTDELACYIFLLLLRWCLHYTRRGRSNHGKVYVRFMKFMAGD
jgi:hypothetical protein